MDVYVLITQPDETEVPDLDIIVYPDFRKDEDGAAWLPTVEVKISTDTDDHAEAFAQAMRAIAPVGGIVEKVTVDRGEIVRHIDGVPHEVPYTIVGVSEIARTRGVSRQHISRQSNEQGFPPVLANLSAGPVWQAGEVLRHLRDAARQKRGRSNTRARY